MAITVDRFRALRALALLAGLAAAALAPAAARGIVVQSSTDESGTEPDVDRPARAEQFSSSLVVHEPTLADRHAEVTLNYAWSMGALHTGALSVALPFVERQLGWSLTIQVQDPAARGFELAVDSRLRGILGGVAEGPGFGSSSLPRLELGVYEMFAPTPRWLDRLAVSSTQVWASDDDTARAEVDAVGREIVGRYRGTQSFLFFLQPVVAVADAAAFMPGRDSQAWQQFGVATDWARLDFVNPGAGDPAAEDLGQFLRISVDYAAPPVPEPANWALTAGGVAVLLLRRRGLAKRAS